LNITLARQRKMTAAAELPIVSPGERNPFCRWSNVSPFRERVPMAGIGCDGVASQASKEGIHLERGMAGVWNGTLAGQQLLNSFNS
jgi:hypothetical protein